MEEVSDSQEDEPVEEPRAARSRPPIGRRSSGTTVGKVAPEGPQRPCPNCGSTKLRSLVKADEVAAFYEACQVRAPLFTLSHPRECKSCGHRWEVTPSKFMLMLALFVLGVCLVLGVVGAVGLAVIAIGALVNPENGRSPVETIRVLGYAIVSACLAAGSWFGVRYYWAKLRKKSLENS